ncbi:hypothetical protein GCM10008904_03750 [Paraclostridium ghonii]|uniref:Uncharacterized protein n=1 Tax=Paraclostridium ghonii TaxID=29358 RepID=A0ABU0N0M7_9FIRM|nr:hypothetical protein [Paeniclostridium ghonii]MDQ0556723.1 hypothetical protein [Paeniclostridium ghonii]
MTVLDVFVNNLCGTFNNNEQLEYELKEGELKHPYAKHINGICNDKIKNLPKDFKGYFVIEESYYKQGDVNKISPHLFLFTLNEDNKVVLTSYELPCKVNKEDFRNDNESLIIDYNDLIISEKFTPMVYDEFNGVFTGESISYFSPTTRFEIKERIEDSTLYVSEVFYKNDKLVFGSIDPIIYKRI